MKKYARQTRKVSHNSKKLFHSSRNKTQSSFKMNCTPIVNGKSPVQGSCYTTDTLNKIKEAYNKKYPKQSIKSTIPNDVWNELRNKLPQCKKEDCWLELVDDIKLKKMMDNLLFAPDRPREWLSNPNEWLSNYDIDAVLNKYQISHPHFKLIGPTPIDYDTIVNDKCVWNELCKLSLQKWIDNGKTDFGIVFNLDDHDESGSHWVSMYVSTKDKLIFYYDSAANPIPDEIIRLKNEIIDQGKRLTNPIKFKFLYNRNTHQRSNTECGMYSLFFIITFLTGKTEFDPSMTLKDKIELFMKKRIPDKYVEKYRNIYFN
jgi:hypothetical protein